MLGYDIKVVYFTINDTAVGWINFCIKHCTWKCNCIYNNIL